jgi:NTE family protein
MKRALVLSGGGARGSFQAGVWKYLTQIGWKPDIICGTSVGSVNAAAIGSGMDVKTLIHLWTEYNRRRMYRFNFLQFFAYLLSGRAIKPLLDITPLKEMILSNLDFKALKSSRTDIVITAVNLLTGQPEFFTQKEIQLEHILASSAMPLLFPWQEINGEPYWDGGVMVNTPIAPALDFGADEIIVVLLSPVGHKKLEKPDNILTAGEHLFEHFLSGSYQANLMNYGFKNREFLSNNNNDKAKPKLITLAPSKMLGFKSLLSFSKAQAYQLIEEGYNTACTQLGGRL